MQCGQLCAAGFYMLIRIVRIMSGNIREGEMHCIKRY